MTLGKHHLVLLVVNLVVILIYGTLFLRADNYEFLGYIAVMVLGVVAVGLTLKKVAYPYLLLWGLTLWGFMHLSGGGIPIGHGQILYSKILIPITPNMFRYDQLVHIIGFGFATYLMYVLLRPYLASARMGPGLVIVIVMAGLGVGALNEIIEFVATVLLPQTGVGGYVNTALDLVADALGAVIASLFIYSRAMKSLA